MKSTSYLDSKGLFIMSCISLQALCTKRGQVILLCKMHQKPSKGKCVFWLTCCLYYSPMFSTEPSENHTPVGTSRAPILKYIKSYAGRDKVLASNDKSIFPKSWHSELWLMKSKFEIVFAHFSSLGISKSNFAIMLLKQKYCQLEWWNGSQRSPIFQSLPSTFLVPFSSSKWKIIPSLLINGSWSAWREGSRWVPQSSASGKVFFNYFNSVLNYQMTQTGRRNRYNFRRQDGNFCHFFW